MDLEKRIQELEAELAESRAVAVARNMRIAELEAAARLQAMLSKQPLRSPKADVLRDRAAALKPRDPNKALPWKD